MTTTESRKVIIAPRKDRTREDGDYIKSSQLSSDNTLSADKQERIAAKKAARLQLKEELKKEIREEMSQEIQGKWSNLKVEVQMKRLTIDVPLYLHTILKTHCASKKLKIADEIRKLLLVEYGQGKSMEDIYQKSTTITE